MVTHPYKEVPLIAYMVEILSPGERIEHTLASFPDQELVAETKAFVHFYRMEILNQLKRKLVRG